MQAMRQPGFWPPRRGSRFAQPVIRMRIRVAVIGLLGLQGLWTATVVSLYFIRPDELAILDGPLTYPTMWRTALAEMSRAVLGALIVLLAGRGAAAIVPERLLPFEHALDRVLVLLAVGLVGVSLLSQGAAYGGLYTPRVVVAGVVLLSIVGVASAGRDLSQLRRPRLRGADGLYAAITVTALLMALVGALAPEIEYDALWYHLWLPQQWLLAGRPVDIVEEYVSLYPLGWDLLYGAALTVGGAGAAKLLHFFCLPLLAATTWRLTRELTPDASPALAAALTVAAPTLIWEATTAYVDLALAWYLALAVLAVVRYHATHDRRWLIIGAVVLGGALAIKHLGLVAMAIIGTCLVGAEFARSRRIATVLRTGLLFALVALAVPAPWYARAFLQAGNPVFPDLYGVFGASPEERWSDVAERGLGRFKARFGRERTAANLLTLPWDVTVHGARYGGTLGPLFLLLIPAALLPGGRMRHRAAVIAACGAYLAVWASPISSFQLRFVIPLVPLLAVLGALGAERIGRLARSLSAVGSPAVTAMLAILLVLNLPVFTEAHDNGRERIGLWLTHVMGPLPISVVIGAESREQYLERRVPSFRAWQFINHHLPADARILTFTGGDHFYSARRRLWSDATAARPLTWGAAAGAEDQVRTALPRRGITHVLFDRRQLTDGSVDDLAIASAQMRNCCLYPIYSDARSVLYEVVSTMRRPVDGQRR
jgi:hypothetical protein